MDINESTISIDEVEKLKLLNFKYISHEEILNGVLTRTRILSRQILSSLRQKNPKLKAVSTTMYNYVKATICSKKLECRIMIQALVEELGKGKFEYDILHDVRRRYLYTSFLVTSYINYSD